MTENFSYTNRRYRVVGLELMASCVSDLLYENIDCFCSALAFVITELVIHCISSAKTAFVHTNEPEPRPLPLDAQFFLFKIHQKPFGGRAQPGPAGEHKRSPRPLAARGKGRKWKRREGEGKRGRGKGRAASSFC